MVVVILITFSFVSVAYPMFDFSGCTQVRICFQCTPAMGCFWSSCTHKPILNLACIGYSYIPNGGCCGETRTK